MYAFWYCILLQIISGNKKCFLVLNNFGICLDICSEMSPFFFMLEYNLTLFEYGSTNYDQMTWIKDWLCDCLLWFTPNYVCKCVNGSTYFEEIIVYFCQLPQRAFEKNDFLKFNLCLDWWNEMGQKWNGLKWNELEWNIMEGIKPQFHCSDMLWWYETKFQFHLISPKLGWKKNDAKQWNRME